MIHLKRLTPFLAPYRRRLVVLVAVMLVGLAANTAMPYILARAVDEGIRTANLPAVLRLCAILVGMGALGSICSYVQGVLQGEVGTNVVRDLRNVLFHRLQHLPIGWYTRMPTGQIMSRMLSDLDSVEQFVAFGFSTLIRESLVLVTALAACLWLDWQLTVVVLLPLPLLLRQIVRFRSRIDPAWAAIREQMGRLTAVLQEVISGVRVVKAFARERHAARLFEAQNLENRRRNVTRARMEADYFPAADFFSSMSWIILVLAGALRLIDGTLEAGVFFAFNWYIWSLIWPLRTAGFLVNIMRQAAASAPRLFEIADAVPGPGWDRTDGYRPSGEPAGSIEFRDVHFAFPDEPDRAVLNGVSFSVQPGETVALLGATGSGKSAVISLVPRFFDVRAGHVRVDGVDVREWDVRALRSLIAIVPQETFLFSATLRENIAFGRPDAPEAEVLAAARAAQVHEFAETLKDGYATRVGERGVGLSGGQRQRVSLARAVLMNPRILILDEATSAVDTATEVRIQQALAQVLRGRTALVVAQRLSTIRNAHRIVVLRDGAVAEQGTHAELYAVRGEYRRLFDLQFRDQDERDEISEEVPLVATATEATP